MIENDNNTANRRSLIIIEKVSFFSGYISPIKTSDY
jgi:hypothetical protein